MPTFAVFQELYALEQHAVAQHDHVLRHVLDERQEAALGVEPRVGAELLLVRLQRLDHARYAELVVALGAVQGPAITITYMTRLTTHKPDRANDRANDAPLYYRRWRCAHSMMMLRCAHSITVLAMCSFNDGVSNVLIQ